ncbi:MAG: hypothetical protein Ct9H300mP1_08100 [Planctomycetaceae bacterium]|nr:MAG: hypothetical protein Ct9H300mP1_08100 [Planctomycetaceae bacterium]
MKIREGDLVVVIAGEDKGPSPRRVVQVLDGGKKIRVKGSTRSRNMCVEVIRRVLREDNWRLTCQLTVPMCCSTVAIAREAYGWE